jgi:hypothetical protein
MGSRPSHRPSSNSVTVKEPENAREYCDRNRSWNPAAFDELYNDMLGMFPNVGGERIKRVVELYGVDEASRITDELLRISGEQNDDDRPRASASSHTRVGRTLKKQSYLVLCQ